MAVDDADDGGGDRDNKTKTTISISHKRGRGEERYDGGEDKWGSPGVGVARRMANNNQL